MRPFVELSWDKTSSQVSSSGSMALANCLPNSTPHWSNELMSQMMPCTKILCSYNAVEREHHKTFIMSKFGYVTYQSMHQGWKVKVSWLQSSWLDDCQQTPCEATSSPAHCRTSQRLRALHEPDPLSCPSSVLLFGLGNSRVESCGACHQRWDYASVQSQWNRKELDECPDGSIDRRHAGHWCQAHPRQLDLYCRKPSCPIW